jgi:hypothetical protein
MWKKIAIAGGVCAAVAGIGTAAMATSGSSDTSGAPSRTSGAPSATAAAGEHHAGKALRRALHAQWVTQGKDHAFVTHDAIRGTVTAVSPTSITIQAADNRSETFAVTGDTKVRVRVNGKGAKGAIAQVHTGDRVAVVGTGTGTLTARGVLDAGT